MLGYGKTGEVRRIAAPGESWGGRPWSDPSGLVAGAPEASGAQLHVQHLQEELNTRLRGQLCWNSLPATQL